MSEKIHLEISREEQRVFDQISVREVAVTAQGKLIVSFWKVGVPMEQIIAATQLSRDKILQILREHGHG